MNWLKLWWRKRRFFRACAVVQAQGLTVVRIKEIAGVCYVVIGDGSYRRLSEAKKHA